MTLLLKLTRPFPDRFVAGIAIPVRDPVMALKELNRVAGKPGMRAVHLPNSIEQRDYLFEPEFEPIFARAQELGYPLLFHPLDGEPNIYSKRLAGQPSLTNWLGFTFKEYVRRFHYDYLNYYPEALRFLIDEVGSERIVIGTDLFAAKDIEYPNSFVEQLKLPAADLDRILRGNAKRLLHL